MFAEDAKPSPVAARATRQSWAALTDALDRQGFAVTGPLLTPAECRYLMSLYADPSRFRSRVIMQRHSFGRGEYQYFGYPLPPLVQGLREAVYPHLAMVANRWAEALRLDVRFPARLDQYLARCHAAGQARPTPLVLKYEAGDYNCLHQDLYGPLVFPVQLTVLLSEPGTEFTGGEFLLVEHRPRAQSKAEVVPLGQGEAVIFAVNERPVRGTRGFYRVKMRHGVSRIRSGQRFTLGVIFHDAA
jgi:hypothetical protein